MRKYFCLSLAAFLSVLFYGRSVEAQTTVSLKPTGTPKLHWAQVPITMSWDQFRRLDHEVLASTITITNFNLPKVKDAAMQGHVPSQVLLAQSYLDGKNGLQASRSDAYNWASLSAACGAESGKWMVKELELFMTPKELAEAREAGQEFTRKQGVPGANNRVQ